MASPAIIDNANKIEFGIPKNIWRDELAEKMTEQELLLYRSNLLGSDLTITNFGGGNTSAKINCIEKISNTSKEILWVKGSGGDIRSMKLDGFATLYMEKFKLLEQLYRGPEFEDEMVYYFPHCTYDLNPRAASIDTPLHGLLPFAHIDHVHPDSIIAIAAAKDGEDATKEIWKGKVGWVAWRRPGFELGIILRDYVQKNNGIRGIILQNHGLICWGDSAKSCYENTISLISDAADYLNSKNRSKLVFGGSNQTSVSNEEALGKSKKLIPILRAIMGQNIDKLAHFSNSPEVMEFVNSRDFKRLAAIGTSCPDHFLRTKIAPMCLDYDKIEDREYLTKLVHDYRKKYQDYYERNAIKSDPKMRDSNPVVVLIPNIGMITFANDKTTARLAGEFYINAINVMRGAEALGGYVSLDESEAFAIEYWSLEEAKLQRMPKPRPLVGKVAFITGGAGGIGAACARKLLSEGACVLIADFDKNALEIAEAELKAQFPADLVRATICDVRDENQIAAAFEMAALEFGGIDILVANAGIASSAPIDETSHEMFQKNFDVLVGGYFLAARECFKMMKIQKRGSIIFIGSKNALAASPNASAYASAKAASLHLARCLALEGAPFGIRVNTVNPDAVIKGSKIWSGEWRKERAQTFGIDHGDELEAHYRNRSLLKLDVLPEDVAQAVYFFASDLSSKSTGNMLNIDAGNALAFPR